LPPNRRNHLISRSERLAVVEGADRDTGEHRPVMRTREVTVDQEATMVLRSWRLPPLLGPVAPGPL
jgi:hypothetical protein